jgi:hypothetical protein
LRFAVPKRVMTPSSKTTEKMPPSRRHGEDAADQSRGTLTSTRYAWQWSRQKPLTAPRSAEIFLSASCRTHSPDYLLAAMTTLENSDYADWDAGATR